MNGQPKLSSRLSSLNMFGKFTASRPPAPVEKDPWYQQGGSKSTVSLAPSHALSVNTASIASMSVETLQLPQTPLSIAAARSQSDLSRTMSPISTRSRTTTMTASTVHSQTSEMSSLRRGISKLSSSLGKKSKLFLRSNLSRTTLSTDSIRASEDGMVGDSEGEEDVSRPWNFQHHLHVDEGLTGLPPEWMDQLRAGGFKDSDILSTHSRRNRTTYLQQHPDVSPDALRAQSRSPYPPSSSSASPSSLSPLPANALPSRSSSLRRPTTTGADDNASVSTSARGGGSSRSPDSYSPPSSYGFSSPSRPSVSSISSRAPSDGDGNDYADPGTATAAQFGVCAGRTPVTPCTLPRMDGMYGDPPSARIPPSRLTTATFHVVNATPPSPPPAYDPSEPGSAQTQIFPRDEKHGMSRSSPRGDSRRASGSDVQLQDERHSEETLTPEVLLRNEDSVGAPSGCITRSNTSPRSPSETQTSLPPFRLHLSRASRDESLSPSPPESPVTRTASLPPRLSLHQDDLGSWSASLFSAMSTPDPELGSFMETAFSSASASASAPTAPAKATLTTLPKSKKSPVPPLNLSRPRNEIPRVTIETDDESIETGAGTSTPLFDEVLSLVKPSAISSPNSLSPVTSTYPYLPSPPLVPSPGYRSQSYNQHSPSQSPNQTYEFLKEHYDPQRNSSASTSTGSHDSQATMSSSSRWSRATTVRDVRDATIAVAHVRKTSVANAMTIPAPAPSRHTPQPSASTIRSGGSGSTDGSRPLSSASSDGVSFPSASDFPLPPPSPSDGAFSVISAQASPMSATFSTKSAGDDVMLPYTVADTTPINRLSSPASTRSSQSSSGSGSSSSSSQVNPLSITSGSDEGPEGHDDNLCLPGAVHVELRYTESESEGSVLSPTDSTECEVGRSKWGAEQGKFNPTAQIDITPRIFTSEVDDNSVRGPGRDRLCCERDEEGDSPSVVVDWLEDTPSQHYEQGDRPIRDSVTVYNHLGEPSPRGLLHPGVVDKARERTPQVKRPSLQINGIATLDEDSQKPLQHLSPASADASSSSSSSASTPSTMPSPLQRYRGWVSEVVAPLEEFIDHTLDPRTLYTDMQEIAEGESGSVFVATIVPLRAPDLKMAAKGPKARSGRVAVKQVPLLPGGSPKLGDLRKELMLMSRITHTNILSMDALFVDLVEDALWIEMELMERSLADILALAEEGLVLQENVIARFMSDILSALAYLETLGIVHRDVRSDNLLVNSQGVLKIADFSHALLVDPAYPTYTDPAGVIYWQAPEMRNGTYDARKADVWSAGATAWEMAEAAPPFMGMDITDPQKLPERWPALSQSDTYSHSFHDFLTLCSNPLSSRPSANDLLMTPFIRSSCARYLVMDLLSQCKSIEERIHRRLSSDSQGTVLS